LKGKEMKKISILFISIFLLSIPFVRADDNNEFPFSYQLRLVRKIEYPTHKNGIGPLIVEVDEMNFDICLKAVQSKIKTGFISDYQGDFDNSFLNELMIGVENLDALSQRSNHAHRKIEFKLKRNAPATPTPFDAEEYVKRNQGKLSEEEIQEYARLYVSGLDNEGGFSRIICHATLTPSHKFLGLNFIQYFFNLPSQTKKILGFVLFDNQGTIMWQQSRNKEKAESPDQYFFINKFGPATEEPIRVARVSNKGHVLAFHVGSNLCWESIPLCSRLYDIHGKIIKEWSSFSSLDFFEFSGDGSRLLVFGRDGKKDEDYLISINTSTGDFIWDYWTNNAVNSYHSINQSYDSSRILFCEYLRNKKSNNLLLVNEKGEVISRKAIDYKIRSPFTAQLLPEGNIILLSGQLYDTDFNLKYSHPKINIKSKSAIKSLTASLFDTYGNFIIRAGCTWTSMGNKSNFGIGNRIINVYDSQFDPLASLVFPRNYFHNEYTSPDASKISSLACDSKSGKIYFFSLTEYLELEFNLIKEKRN